MPFPGIISRICVHPCTEVCLRSQAGDPIDIRALERACMSHASPEPEKSRPMPRRQGRVAVLGGGISGLTAAHDLARKGYQVTIFEAGGQLGGSIWRADPRDLPPEVIEADLAVIHELGIQVEYNSPVGRPGGENLSQLRRRYDAVYVAIGAHSDETLGLGLDESGRVAVDPVTFATSTGGVFAGGGLLWGKDMRSSVTSISEGRRAAISVDRFLQEVSLTASRQNEGPYTTRLFTSLEGVEPADVVDMADPEEGYEWHETIQEAKRCLQCECMECVKACEYLKHYGRYPRKYVREVYNNLSIVKGTRFANKLINSCALCGLCGEICPEGLDMGSVIRPARQQMVREKRMPPSAHDFALRDLAFNTGDDFRLVRNQPGTASSQYVFFPGCQLSASRPEAVRQIYSHLSRGLDGGVGLMLGCCGAPADWAGRPDLFENVLAGIRAARDSLGTPRLILGCPSCYQVFKTNLPDVEIVSLWEILAGMDLPPGAQSGDGRTVTIHDPCTARHEPGLQDSARALVERLGYRIEELKYSRGKTVCCSYGGHMWLANPEVGRKVVDRRITESPLDYVTYCAMCRDFFAARGKPAFHVLDLLFGGTQASTVLAGPGYSQRHENRSRLKRQLLRELWGETMDDPQAYATIKLVMSEEVRSRLEERLILTEDIQKVIEHAERTHSRLANRKTGRYLAYYKPNSVTYWVEYTPEDGAFIIHNAYSHRMEVDGSPAA